MISFLQKGLKFIPYISSSPDTDILKHFSEFQIKFQTKLFMSNKKDNSPFNRLLKYPTKFMPSETSNEIDALCYNIRDLIVLQLEEINRLENDHFISKFNRW